MSIRGCLEGDDDSWAAPSYLNVDDPKVLQQLQKDLEVFDYHKDALIRQQNEVEHMIKCRMGEYFL